MRYYVFEINKWYDMAVSLDKIKYIYECFRKAQAFSKSRGYRLPKDFEKHFNEKMAKRHKEILIKISEIGRAHV